MAQLDDLETAALPSDAVEVARIGQAWGVNGWFKVHPYSADPQAVFCSKRWFIQPAAQGPRNFVGTRLLKIEQAREHGASIVANVADIRDRDQAELLRGAHVFVSRSSFPTAQTDEYYWVDLIGLDVFNREGVNLGRVRDLLPTGPQAVLVLEFEDASGKAQERMIPFVSAYIDAVDLPARRITVNWQPDY